MFIIWYLYDLFYKKIMPQINLSKQLPINIGC